jgi:hypothetical protein
MGDMDDLLLLCAMFFDGFLKNDSLLRAEMAHILVAKSVDWECLVGCKNRYGDSIR